MNTLSITYLVILLCINTISAKDEAYKLQNIEVEFLWESVNHGIIEKFSEFFNNDEMVDDLLYADEFDDNYDEDQSTYIKDEEEYSYMENLYKIKSVTDEDGDISKEFKINAEKLCLLSVLAKETTIHYKENISV